MGRKASEATDPNSCLSKAADDEPIFVLRAQDKTAPKMVRVWAINSGLPANHPKRQAAMRLALEMEEWQKTHTSKQPD